MTAVAAMTYLTDQPVSVGSGEQEAGDGELLRRYLGGGAEGQDAFAELVRRHVNMVYGAARRQLSGDAHLAEDVTQAVFMVLARRAGKLDPGMVLVGWLYNTARYCAANAKKIEARRRHHEAKGGVMDRVRWANENCAEIAGDAPEAMPYLDAALSSLSSRDRDAVLLKYIAGKTHKAVGEALGVTEEAARKRVDRAVDKLREFFAERGLGVSAIAVAGLLGTASGEAAPVGLAGSIASSAAAAAGAGGTTTAAIANGAMLTMLMAKVKLAAVIVIGMLVLGTAGAVVVRQQITGISGKRPAAQVNRPTRSGAPVPAKPPAAPPSMVTGVVKSVSGEPVSGARVQIATRDRPVNVYSDKPTGARQSVTADDGYFSFDMGAEPCYVVVKHELGFANLTREQLAAAENNVVTLQPWARVEGVAKIGDKPAMGTKIVVHRVPVWDSPYSQMLQFSAETIADDQGRYAFDRVAPGDTWVSRLARPPMRIYTMVLFVETESGKTAKVNLGGTGRPIVGKLVMPPGSQEPVEWVRERGKSYHAGIAMSPMPLFPPTQTPDWVALSFEERRQKTDAWLRTPAGRYYQKARSHWGFSIEPDGSFRMEDVPAGGWRFYAQADVLEGANMMEPVASMERYFSVADMPGGRSDDPLDLGTMFLSPVKRLRMGKPAPDFAAKGLDGKDVKPSDFRGKMLVLYFFGAGQLPDERQVAQLKQLFEKKANEVALLGVNYDDNPEVTKQFVEKNGLKWPHAASRFGWGLMDTLKGTGIPPQYNPYPSRVFLIDEKGNVIGKNIQADEIEGTVYRALLER
jgi:RNA polymerase sigma factor (sigma-70 family)